MTDLKKTVTFDVGGKHYKVARSTIDKYQDSMLARLASDTWDGNKDEPIFVDASSERFDFVLDYMRHDEIDVPVSISRDAVMKDLKYFCLPFEESQIKSIRKYGAERVKEILVKLTEHKAQSDLLNKEKDYISFASWCTGEALKNCQSREFELTLRSSDKDRPFAFEHFRSSSFDSVLCQACLAEVGLEIKEGSIIGFERWTRFTIRPL